MAGVLPVQHRDAVEVAQPSSQARTKENIGEHGQLGESSGRAHETKSD